MTRNITSDTEATKLPALMSRDGWTSHSLVCSACAQVHSWELSPVGAGCEVYHPGENHAVVVSPVGSGPDVTAVLFVFCARLCSFSLFVLFFGIVRVSCIQHCCSAAWAATCATNNLRLTLHLSPSPSFFECVFFRTRNFNFWIVDCLRFSGANLCTLLVLLLISSGEGLFIYTAFGRNHTSGFYSKQINVRHQMM